jgi:hypothetical protein
LIKHYELELHYHPDKANVATNALSRKAHYNYLLAVLPDLSLYNMTLTPILMDEIIAAEKNDEGMAHIKRIIQEGDSKVNCFQLTFLMQLRKHTKLSM